MSTTGQRWFIILAGGQGTRLESVAPRGNGVPIPKQYCDFGAGKTLLQLSIERALRHAPAERVVVVVAKEHEIWWRPLQGEHSPCQFVVQPRARGTAAGVLLPFLRVVQDDPQAVVCVLPSDHHVDDEGPLKNAIERTLRAAGSDERLVLLGVEPHGSDADYGFIIPSAIAAASGAMRVAAFVEKPSRHQDLLARPGVLWNSFVMAGSSMVLLRLYFHAAPQLLRTLLQALRNHDQDALAAAYDEIPTQDFCRELLAPCVDRLAVVKMPPCGWMDLGTPARLGQYQARVLSARSPSSDPRAFAV